MIDRPLLNVGNDKHLTAPAILRSTGNGLLNVPYGEARVNIGLKTPLAISGMIPPKAACFIL